MEEITKEVYKDKICEYCQKKDSCSQDKFTERISNITKIKTKLCTEYIYKN